jgi:hypothetical protein
LRRSTLGTRTSANRRKIQELCDNTAGRNDYEILAADKLSKRLP